MKSRPFVIGGASLLFGYLWAYLSGMERPIPRELIAFHQAEQMKRLKSIITSPFRAGS
jgi:hypothetical protein